MSRRLRFAPSGLKPWAAPCRPSGLRANNLPNPALGSPSILISQVIILGTSGRAQASINVPMNFDDLKEACKGVVATAGDANFTELLHGNLWNRLIPDRAPQVLVRVNDEQDVVAAILFARANKLKVVVRGGGHNWCQPTLRNGGVLIDLTNRRCLLHDRPHLCWTMEPVEDRG
jgi:hypothetical protein